MKPSVKLALLLLVVGMGLGGYEFYEFQMTKVPQLDKRLRDIETKRSSKQAELKRVQSFASNMETVKKELRDLNFQLEAALEHLPRNFNVSALLRKLTLLAQNSGLELYTFRPSYNEEKKEGSFYNSTDIQVELRGTFTEILVFLDQVSRLKRIVNPEELHFILASDNPRRPSGKVLTASAKVKAYRFSE